MSADYIHLPSRRTVLKGLGASLTLPFFPSLMWGEDPLAADADRAPRRYAALIFSNGVNEAHWWQETDAQNRLTGLSKTLKPLQGFEDDLLFLNNLHLFDDTRGVHNPYFSNFLNGHEYSKGIPDQGESVDRFIARTTCKTTPVPAINLGIEGGNFGNTTISWSSPTTPVPVEIFPRAAFDRLFDVSSLERDRSILDHVLGQAKGVRGKLNTRDQHKLDEYMESIREIERRIELATSEDRFEGWRPTLEEPNLPRPEDGKPHDIPEHMKLQLDIMILGLQMDKTRVCTYVFEKDVGGMRFNFLDGVSKSGIHDISHHRKREQTLEEYQKINQYHVELLAYAMKKMKNIDEGHGTTLLDNTMMLFGSTMMDGDVHEANKLPLVVCGGKSAGIQGGRSLHYDKLEDRRLCNLHLDMARRMGADVEQFGNSHYPLPGIGG